MGQTRHQHPGRASRWPSGPPCHPVSRGCTGRPRCLRRAAIPLGAVLFLSVAMLIGAMAIQQQWRSGARTMSLVRDRMALADLARSALSETGHAVQSSLDGNGSFVAWLTATDPVTECCHRPTATIRGAGQLSRRRGGQGYQVGDVRITRRKSASLWPGGSGDRDAVIDLSVTISSKRSLLAAVARLTLVHRYVVTLRDSVGGRWPRGRRLVLSRRPVATAIREG